MNKKTKTICGMLGIVVVIGMAIYLFNSSSFDESEIKTIETNLKKDKNITKYVSFLSLSEENKHKTDNTVFHNYVIEGNVNKDFMSLTDEKKLEALSLIVDEINIKSDSMTFIGCGEKNECSIDKIQMFEDSKKAEVNSFTIDLSTSRDDYEMEIAYHEDGDFKTKTVALDEIDDTDIDTYETNSMANNDSTYSEITISNKDGSDWNELSESDKFHAISNLISALDDSGSEQLIKKDEYFYISALDEFYNTTDDYVLNTSVQDAVSMVIASSQ
ncbi:hypothetical protein GFV16_00055 [Bacillus megaterium]|uniref:hypothetical protein n=1 Tax=Priestia megaterium TaxID=1404 RepID=UPI001293C232|nr:hypothetical protein [Priestia megaterium]MQR84336.1 hypothetical protein [Priestia megaterium]